MCWRTSERKARTDYTCDLCKEPIKAGEVYLYAVHLPDHKCSGSTGDADWDCGSDGFETFRQHTGITCPKYLAEAHA